MDNSMIRIVAAVLALVFGALLVMRRRSNASR